MPSLLLVVFVLELVIHLINTIGAAAISNLLWTAYLCLPTQTSKDAAARKQLQKEYLKVRQELNATSSQDQFAKWAKLRRQHDKLLDQLEKTKNSHDGAKARFEKTVGAVRWVGTQGLKLAIPWWYAKQPMFWLPQGWFPYWAEWVLSFPRAPLGSVSIASWQVACTLVIAMASDAVKGVIGAVVGLGGPAAKEKPVGSGSGGKEQKGGEKDGGKAAQEKKTQRQEKKDL